MVLHIWRSFDDEEIISPISLIYNYNIRWLKKVIFFLQKIRRLIIMLCSFSHINIKMKKILKILVWLFAIFLFFWWSFFIFAEQETGWWGGKEWGWWNTTSTTTSEIGLDLQWGCLTWMWKWCFQYETMIWIESKARNITPLSIAQDVIFSATYFVWTVLTAILIYCGLWYIFAARDWKDTNSYKKWLISAMIWALLVRWAYAIVRLIQYMAKW